MPDPATVSAALTIGSTLAKLGQGYFAGKDAERAQKRMDRKVAQSNLINAFGGPGTSVPTPESVRPGKATTILGGLGKALDVGSTLHGLKQAHDMRGLQMDQAEGAIRDAEIARVENIGYSIPEGTDLQDVFRAYMRSKGEEFDETNPVPNWFASSIQQGQHRRQLSDSELLLQEAQIKKIEADTTATTERISIEQHKLDLERTKANAELAASGVLSKKDRAAMEATLRKELSKQNEDLVELTSALNKILSSAKMDDPTGVSDLALIFNFYRILDPRSTVREGEFKAAVQSGRLGDKFTNIINQYWDGERLTTTRDQFYAATRDMYESQLPAYRSMVKHYAKVSEDLGVKASNVIMDVEDLIDMEGVEAVGKNYKVYFTNLKSGLGGVSAAKPVVTDADTAKTKSTASDTTSFNMEDDLKNLDQASSGDALRRRISSHVNGDGAARTDTPAVNTAVNLMDPKYGPAWYNYDLGGSHWPKTSALPQSGGGVPRGARVPGLTAQSAGDAQQRWKPLADSDLLGGGGFGGDILQRAIGEKIDAPNMRGMGQLQGGGSGAPTGLGEMISNSFQFGNDELYKRILDRLGRRGSRSSENKENKEWWGTD